jgi:hypothetical protein
MRPVFWAYWEKLHLGHLQHCFGKVLDRLTLFQIVEGMFDFCMLFDLQLQGRNGLRNGLYELLPVHAALQNTDDGLPSACVQVFEHTIPCCSTHQVFVHDLRKHMQIVNCHGRKLGDFREGRYAQGQKLLEVISLQAETQPSAPAFLSWQQL